MGKAYTKLFGPDSEQPEIYSKLENLSKLYNYTPDDLLLQWETFKSNVIHNTNEKLSEPKLDSLHTYIQEKISRQGERSQTTPNFVKIRGLKANGLSSSLKKNSNNGINTPLLKKRKLNFSSPANTSMDIASDPDLSINNTTLIQTNTGTILESLAPTGLPSKETTELNKDVKLMANFNPKKYNYRTQNMKPLEIADYLDDQIDRMAEIIQRYHNLNLEEFGDPTRMSQSQIVAVGRVVPETPLATWATDLNLESLFLETARDGPHGGYGKRVRLDFTELLRETEERSFFPGQLVAFKGINNDGLSFKIKSVLKIPYLGAGAYSSDDVQEFASTFGDGFDDNLKIAIAAGPFHNKSSLDFGYLKTFVDHMNSVVKPDTLILLGPFLDIEILKKMKLPFTTKSNDQNQTEFDTKFNDIKTPEQIFKSFIAPILSMLECPKIILIPHSNDAVTSHTVYPQAGFNRKDLGLPKQFKCFPDPSVFHINEIGIGATNVDIFRGLKDVTINSSNSNLTRIDRIVTHLFQQRHFHPHMVAMANEKVDIDISYLGLAEIEDELPDVLIIPSVLKRFAKIVKNVVIINPGQLIKGDKNGSFAVLQVARPKISNSTDRVQLNSLGEPVQNQILSEDSGEWSMHKVNRKGDDEEEVYEEYLTDIWRRCRVDLYSI